MQTNKRFQGLIEENDHLWEALYRRYFPTITVNEYEDQLRCFGRAFRALYAKCYYWDIDKSDIKLSEALIADHALFKILLSHRGELLEFGLDEIKSDEDSVLRAVNQDGLALEHADPNLRSNEKVVLVAIAQNSRALEHASLSLKKDPFFQQMKHLSERECQQICQKELKRLRSLAESISSSSTLFASSSLPTSQTMPPPHVKLSETGSNSCRIC